MEKIIGKLKTTDLKLFYWLNHRLHCTILNHLMSGITNLGGAAFTIALSLLLIFYGKGKLESAAAHGLVSLTVSFLLGLFLKKITMRQRPYLVLDGVNVGGTLFTDYAFPSGHTTSIFSLAVSYSIIYPDLALPLVLVATLVGVSRVYLGQHYPIDIIAGGCLGSATAILIHIY